MSLIASLGFPERMAMTMAESIIRKACDRCHSQKLSCKRVGDEACERCVRLRTECKSSPSLRYKKQHQQPPQQQQQTSSQPYQRASHQTRSQASYQRKQEQQLQLHQQQHQQLQLHQQQQQQHQHQQHQQHQPQHQQHQHQHQHQHHQQHHPGQQQLQQQQQQQALGQLPSPAPQPQIPVGDTKLPISTRSPKRRRTDSEQSIPIIGERGISLLDEGSEVVRIEDQVGLGGEATLTPIDFDFGQFEELDFFATSSQPPISHQGASVSGTIESFQPQPPAVPPAFSNPWTTQHIGHHHHHQQQQQQQLHQPPHHHPHHPHHHQQTAEAAFPHAQVTTLPPAESGGLVPCGLSSSSPSSHIDVRGTTVVVAPDHQTSIGSQKRRRQRRPRNRPRQIALRHVANASSSTSPPSSSSNNSSSSGNVHWMAQLSEINSRLVELASSLPQPQVSPAFNVQLMTPTAGGHNAGDDGGFPIDEMFKLTRRVADVLDRWSAGYHHHHGGGAVAVAVAAAAAPTIDSSDPGNSMFVLSTYVRLLDMYQKVFSLVRIELSQANCEAAFRFWRLPDVQVGSFSVDPSPSLQMSLTIQLAEEFLARLRAATAALDPALSNGGVSGHAVNNNTASAAAAMEESSSSSTSSAAAAAAGRSMFSEVVDVSYQAVKSKEESLGKHLAELRDEIEALLDV